MVAEADGRGDATPSKGTPRKKARDPVTPKKDGKLSLWGGVVRWRANAE